MSYEETDKSINQAIAFWQKRFERNPEPLKSFAREHINQLLLLQDNQNGIARSL